MTIKSQGGIFGRNPTFKDVEVDGTLTVGGNAVPDASTLLVDGDIGSTVQAYDADTAKLDANQTFTGSNNFTQNVYIQNSSFPTFSLYNAGGERVKLYYDTNTGFAVLGTTVAAPVKFYVNNGEVASFTTSGNLAFPSGNGIDFSATAGTGTSELFDDYEEGSWDMVLTSASGSFTTATIDPNATAYYTKIGRHVFIQGYFMTDAITVGTATGDIYISLPFTAANLTGYGDGGTGAVGYAASWGGDVPSSVYPRGGDSKMNLHYRTSANGSVSNMQVGDLATGANSNVVVFTAMYIAA